MSKSRSSTDKFVFEKVFICRFAFLYGASVIGVTSTL